MAGASPPTRHFNRSAPASLPGIIASMGQDMVTTGRSVMVHVEGTRALSCSEKVHKLSGAFIDMALTTGRPIVPVRFVGGLPTTPLAERVEFPVHMGRQDIILGELISADSLGKLDYRERRTRVLSALNELEPPASSERPLDADLAFEASVHDWMAQTGVSLGHATMFRILEELEAPCPPIRELVRSAHSGRLMVEDNTEGCWLAEVARRLGGERTLKVDCDVVAEFAELAQRRSREG
jgi:hypothetical protein